MSPGCLAVGPWGPSRPLTCSSATPTGCSSLSLHVPTCEVRVVGGTLGRSRLVHTQLLAGRAGGGCPAMDPILRLSSCFILDLRCVWPDRGLPGEQGAQGTPCSVGRQGPDPRPRWALSLQSSTQEIGEELVNGVVYSISLRKVQVHHAASRGQRRLGVSVGAGAAVAPSRPPRDRTHSPAPKGFSPRPAPGSARCSRCSHICATLRKAPSTGCPSCWFGSVCASGPRFLFWLLLLAVRRSCPPVCPPTPPSLNTPTLSRGVVCVSGGGWLLCAVACNLVSRRAQPWPSKSQLRPAF